jgi:hypothetical protein
LNSYAPQILTQRLFDQNIDKHEVTLPIIMQNMLFFYSPLLIQIYWITYYNGSLTGGSNQSNNRSVMLFAHENFWWEIWAAWQCECAMVYL